MTNIHADNLNHHQMIAASFAPHMDFYKQSPLKCDLSILLRLQAETRTPPVGLSHSIRWNYTVVKGREESGWRPEVTQRRVMLICSIVVVDVLTFNGKSNIVLSRGWMKWPAHVLLSPHRFNNIQFSWMQRWSKHGFVFACRLLAFVHFQEHCVRLCVYTD